MTLRFDMKNKIVNLDSIEQAEYCISKLEDSANAAQKKLQGIAIEEPMEFLRRVKFEEIGCDPLDEKTSLNFTEQVHQTFTYLASFRASIILFKEYKDKGLKKLTLNLGTASGTDIESDDCGGIAAEVFATVKPSNNNKLAEDIKKVSENKSKQNKYVFYISPKKPKNNPYEKEGVTIRHMDMEVIMPT